MKCAMVRNRSSASKTNRNRTIWHNTRNSQGQDDNYIRDSIELSKDITDVLNLDFTALTTRSLKELAILSELRSALSKD